MLKKRVFLLFFIENGLTNIQKYDILTKNRMIEAQLEISTIRVKAFAGRCGEERLGCRRRSRRKIGLAERENIRYVVAEMRRAIHISQRKQPLMKRKRSVNWQSRIYVMGSALFVTASRKDDRNEQKKDRV